MSFRIDSNSFWAHLLNAWHTKLSVLTYRVKNLTLNIDILSDNGARPKQFMHSLTTFPDPVPKTLAEILKSVKHNEWTSDLLTGQLWTLFVLHCT